MKKKKTITKKNILNELPLPIQPVMMDVFGIEEDPRLKARFQKVIERLIQKGIVVNNGSTYERT